MRLTRLETLVPTLQSDISELKEGHKWLIRMGVTTLAGVALALVLQILSSGPAG